MMSTHVITPKITPGIAPAGVREPVPAFRLRDLGVSEELMLKIEAYFVQYLVNFAECHAVMEIPGLDRTENRNLAETIRRFILRTEREEKRVVDPGVARLLESIGKSAAHKLKLPLNFYELTVEKESIVREALRQCRLPHSQVVIPCMVLHFGMDGNRPHTFRECSDHESIPSDYSPWRLCELLEKALKALAAYLIPIYAKGAFSTADQILLEYLQLAGLYHNNLRRTNIWTVADLIAYTPHELLDLPGMGRKGVAAIEQALRRCGYALA